MAEPSPQTVLIAAHIGDAVSLVAVLGSWTGFLPAFASIAAVVWYLLEIWESDTVQSWVRGPKAVKAEKRARRLARALKEVHAIEASDLKEAIHNDVSGSGGEPG